MDQILGIKYNTNIQKHDMRLHGRLHKIIITKIAKIVKNRRENSY